MQHTEALAAAQEQHDQLDTQAKASHEQVLHDARKAADDALSQTRLALRALTVAQQELEDNRSSWDTEREAAAQREELLTNELREAREMTATVKADLLDAGAELLRREQEQGRSQQELCASHAEVVASMQRKCNELAGTLDGSAADSAATTADLMGQLHKSGMFY